MQSQIREAEGVSKQSPTGPVAKKNENDSSCRFLAAVQSKGPVVGLTHSFYRYPARFSPQFARAAILAFSKPGDVVLDPFMGGGTTLVEASVLGRHSIGCDVNALSIFLTRVKTTPLSDDDLERIAAWVYRLPAHLNLRQPSIRASQWQADGYQRNMPWTIRKVIELALVRLPELLRQRQQCFARCLLLKAGQWALDCRERIPSAKEFRQELFHLLEVFVKRMREYRLALREGRPPGAKKAVVIPLHRAAAELPAEPAFGSLPKKPILVVTSPPYPGVHVLYHRWNIRGRRESPAPFWIANCLDGRGESYYTFGHRRHSGLRRYGDGIRESFAAVRKVIASEALVVQLMAFSEPEWQLPCFLGAMDAAGFEEIMPQSLGIPTEGRLWRYVPGRRWFALIQDNLSTSREVVLFHRPR
jgi:hypothetical protein